MNAIRPTCAVGVVLQTLGGYRAQSRQGSKPAVGSVVRIFHYLHTFLTGIVLAIIAGHEESLDRGRPVLLSIRVRWRRISN